MRLDLEVKQVFYQAEPYWVIKDPLDQQYHQYNEQEYAYRELTTIIREFFKKSVVVSTLGGNGLQLHEFSREKRRQKLQKKLKSVLAIQWSGWDPARFMDATYPLVGWFFSKTVVRLNIAFVLSALLFLFYHYDEFVSRLPGLWSLLDGSNLLILGSVICVTKILHELGHAYVHKRFGGECHEIGMMIFFFVPTLYCNTSDSWMMTDKWKRMAIGAGGVYVEMVIFAVSTFVWWYSGVGLLQDVCLNLMVVCSISAAFTNGNPLMRYDGYFVLADWLEIPNLSQQASKEVKRQFLNKCLGIEREVDQWSSRFNKRVFLTYGLASFAYKVLLIIGISFYLTQQFQFAGLANLGLVIAFVSLSGLFTPPIKSMVQYFKQPGSWQLVSSVRAKFTVGVLVAILAAVFLLPFPFYVPGECTVEMVGQQTVYAVDRGRIETILARPGEWVEQNQPILQLANEDLEAEILDMEVELDELNLRLKYLRTPSQAQDSSDSQNESESGLLTTRRKLESSLKIR